MIALSRNISPQTLLTALFILCLAGCSSDDDGAADDISDPVQVPDMLTYEIVQPPEVVLTIENAGSQVSIDSMRLLGSFNYATDDYTLDSLGPVMAVAAGDFLSELDTELSSALTETVDFSHYNLQVLAAAEWTDDGNPVSGSFIMYDNEYRSITITVSANAGGMGTAGVEIVYRPDGDAGDVYTIGASWAEFDMLFENETAEPYARIAAFGYSILRYMYEQGALVIDALETMADHEDMLQQQGMVSNVCDTYQLPVIPAPPDPTPGMDAFTWHDVDGNSDLGPGDSFRREYTQCWYDDVTDSIDLLLHGTVHFRHYVDISDDNDVLLRLGFDSYQGMSGIDYDNLAITETETTLANIIIDDDLALVLNGGFTMIFASQ